MDSWKHCPRCNVETHPGCGYMKCPSCSGIWTVNDLKGMFIGRREKQRLAAVRELVSDCMLTGEWSLDIRKMAIEKLKSVWPEAVEER